MTAGRWEAIRALGAVTDNPGDARRAAPALGIESPDVAEHTEVFVLNSAPYASIYLGAEGGVGGPGADRVAGFWRAIGLAPPSEPDHLAAVLALYAQLGEATEDHLRPATEAALARMRAALFWEHLWSWAPVYLDAVADLATETLPAWAALTRAVLEAERDTLPGGDLLPAALREAPAGLDLGCGLDELLDSLISPLRSGFVLTRRSLVRLAAHSGVGSRIGERRFTLRAMLEQDPARTVAGLETEAGRWARRREDRAGTDAASRWWAGRAAQTAVALAAAAPAEATR